ncbi:MAG TPA: hypothetical protein VG839_01375 [Asticcacaulis sp.]|nr:hypothetical protein [Asticcacaulis sp.]
MSARFLPDFGKTFLLDTLIGTRDGRITSSNRLVDDTGIFGRVIRTLLVSRTWTFIDERVATDDLLEGVNAGGVASQLESRDELASDIAGRLKARHSYVVSFDPWSTASDIGFDVFADWGARIGMFDRRIYKVCDGRSFAPSQIDDLIAGVSYLKCVFIATAAIHSTMSDEAVFRALLEGVTTIYVNAFDDESWIGASVEAIELNPVEPD